MFTTWLDKKCIITLKWQLYYCNLVDIILTYIYLLYRCPLVLCGALLSCCVSCLELEGLDRMPVMCRCNCRLNDNQTPECREVQAGSLLSSTSMATRTDQQICAGSDTTGMLYQGMNW